MAAFRACCPIVLALFLVGCSVACVTLATIIVGAAFAEALGKRGKR